MVVSVGGFLGIGESYVVLDPKTLVVNQRMASGRTLSTRRKTRSRAHPSFLMAERRPDCARTGEPWVPRTSSVACIQRFAARVALGQWAATSTSALKNAIIVRAFTWYLLPIKILRPRFLTLDQLRSSRLQLEVRLIAYDVEALASFAPLSPEWTMVRSVRER